MKVGEYFQTGLNYYVPRMQAAPGIGDDGLFSASFTPPGGVGVAAANATAVFTARAITNAALTINAASDPTKLPYTVDAQFGRTLRITGGTAGDNAVLTLRGVDYLGQPMTETVTLNGVTAVNTVKAWKRLDSIAVPAGNANASSNINVGTDAKFGLPFKTLQIITEFADDVIASAGTLVNPVLTDPQTAATGDPRGLYTPATTPNGAKDITVLARATATTNASNNGGLHGVKAFFS